MDFVGNAGAGSDGWSLQQPSERVELGVQAAHLSPFVFGGKCLKRSPSKSDSMKKLG